MKTRRRTKEYVDLTMRCVGEGLEKEIAGEELVSEEGSSTRTEEWWG